MDAVEKSVKSEKSVDWGKVWEKLTDSNLFTAGLFLIALLVYNNSVLNDKLSDKIDPLKENQARLEKKIDGVESRLEKQIESLKADMNRQFDQLMAKKIARK